jgi:multidrug efflux pump
MLFATFLGVLLIPVFYIAVRRLLGDKLDGDVPPAARTGNGMQPFDSDPRRGH